MQSGIDVHELTARVRPMACRNRGIDHRPHRYRAFLGKTKQQTELCRPVVTRNDQQNIIACGGKPAP